MNGSHGRCTNRLHVPGKRHYRDGADGNHPASLSEGSQTSLAAGNASTATEGRTTTVAAAVARSGPVGSEARYATIPAPAGTL